MNKLVDTIQQSSAHVRGMEILSAPCTVHHTSEQEPKTKQLADRTAATVRRPEAHVEHATPSQKEIEREQRWER